MNDDLRESFERVAKKMGWLGDNGEGELDAAERKLKNLIGKTRRLGISDCVSTPTVQSDSSDEDFDLFLEQKFAPQARTSPRKPLSAVMTPRTPSAKVVLSSDDDDDASFENFLHRMKTPKTKPKPSENSSDESLKNFIVDDSSSDDDFVQARSTFRGSSKKKTPAPHRSSKKPLSQLNSPVFISDSDDDNDDNIVIRSTWKVRHSKPKSWNKNENNRREKRDENRSPSPPLPPCSFPLFCSPDKVPVNSPKRTFSAPCQMDETSSSEEEFVALLDRLKRKNKLLGSELPTTASSDVAFNKQPLSIIQKKRPTTTPKAINSKENPEPFKTPANPFVKPYVSQTEPKHAPTSRLLCRTPGCFLESLSKPGSVYVTNFKKTKEELARKLYQLYNDTVFDKKLPVDMSVTWNKKMRKTAGFCITGQEKGGGSRYARIEMSEKVCDSADRLRDTLIHEMCHAATWIINGIRDGHGSFWKVHARRATVMHPELPMVTRCHSYDIKYKFQYQCSRCKNTIGRHSKSLDTQKFVCALCTGQLVLLTPSKPRAPTPFANFVKENYKNVRQELPGQSHSEVMRKLSADFATKAQVSES